VSSCSPTLEVLELIPVPITIQAGSKIAKVTVFNDSVEIPEIFPFNIECVVQTTTSFGNQSLSLLIDLDELMSFFKTLKNLSSILDEYLKDENDALFLISDESNFSFASNRFVDKRIMDDYILPLHSEIKKFPSIESVMISRKDILLDTYYHPNHFLTTLRNSNLSFKEDLFEIHISHTGTKLVLNTFFTSKVHLTRLLHISYRDWIHNKKTYAELFELYQSLKPQLESMYNTEDIYLMYDVKSEWNDEFLEVFIKLASFPYLFRLPKFHLIMSRTRCEINPVQYVASVEPLIKNLIEFDNWAHIEIRVN